MLIPDNSRLVFIGDSITDAGRDPCGEHTPWAPEAGFGKGYVMMVDALIRTSRPGARIRIFNRGVSGNTIRDLAGRWEADVLALRPAWVAIFIGINDVWRQFDSPNRPEIAVFPDEYERTYRDLLARTLPQVAGAVLLTPYAVEAGRADPMRVRMGEYGEIVKRLAAEHGLRSVDLQAAFDRLLEHLPGPSIAWDRVHPSPVGHMAIARAFLDAVDFPLA